MPPEAPYRRADLPVDERVADLLERMTPGEKVGQLAGTYVGQLEEPQDVEDVAGQIREHGIGSVSPFGIAVSYYDTVPEVAEVANRLQEVAVEETRLGIPLLLTVDAVHGHAYVRGATVFPNGLGAAATFDPGLVERLAAATAREVAATGAHHNYAPTCDVARDPRWGRTFETYGESPHLVSRLAAAATRGHGAVDGVLSTAKHFPAYGGPVRGEDAAPVEASEYRLRSTYLPPFEAAVEAGVDAVMPCYNAVDGEPAHGSRRFLTDLLREELGFDGPVVSDWGGVDMLHEDHRTAESYAESVRATHAAGLDVASVGGVDHAERLLALLDGGALAEEQVDEHVRRVLEAKFRLGLFEDPYVDPGAATATLGNEDHRALARECARESLTLLTNDGCLPLEDPDELLVTGPNADDLVHQLGGWSVFADGDLPGVTVREGLAAATDAAVTYEPGATVTERRDVEAAAASAAAADAAVVVVGENWYIHEFGPRELSGTDTGEFPTRRKLELPAAQRDLARAVVETGTPTVVVLVTGRPLAVAWLAEHAPALLLAYYPGTMGGAAVADVLVGDADPGGRLPVSIPRSTADLPVVHDRLRHPRPIGDDEHPPDYDPLFPFGHGLSYAEFEYRELSLSPDRVAPDGTVEAAVEVENVGDRPGEDVVQAYASDRYSSRVTPVTRLAGFERVRLAPGEATTVRIPLDVAGLGVVGADGRRRVEAGTFDVCVGDHRASFAVER